MTRCPDCQHDNSNDVAACASCGAALVSGEQTLVHDALPQPEPLTAAQRELVAGVANGVGVFVVDRGPLRGSRFLLEGESTRIGRHPDSEVYLDDITVSRRHAAIARDGEQYVLRDVGSLNGTYVNNARVDDIALRPGDTVQVGRFHLVFLIGLKPA